MLEKRIDLAHFQLTKNCNLRCWFCGQWGKNGFSSEQSGEEMTLADWKRVIDELKRGTPPAVILWGGEPLVSPYFDEIAKYLHENHFSVGMVTNGCLIDEHLETIQKYISRIYLSLDGDEEIHNSVRGKGVFKKVTDNLQLLGDMRPQLILMSVMTEDFVENADKIIDSFSQIAPDEVLLQELIYVTPEEGKNYKAWLKNNFDIQASEIDSWIGTGTTNVGEEKLLAIKKFIQNNKGLNVKYLPHGEETGNDFCLASFRRIHITWNGNLLYCTDFCDFSAGNVKENSVFEIFNNEISEKYREQIKAGKCVTCRHCSWRNNVTFGF